MKKLFLFVCAAMMGTAAAQNNNPQNQAGQDIVNAAIAIQKDYKEGKIKDINQDVINAYYKSLLPGYKVVTLEQLNRVGAAIKNEKSSESAIANSGLSAQAKDFLRKSLTDYSTTRLVDDVKQSKISATEKEQLLLVLAINYNLIPHMMANKNATGKGAAYFDVDFDDAQFARPGAQSVIWGAIGAYTGFAICGPWCAVIGGVMGLVFGGLPGTTTVASNSGGSHTYSNGHPKP